MAIQQQEKALAALCLAGLFLSAPAAAQFTFPTLTPARTDASACAALGALTLPELVSVTAEWLLAGPPRFAAAGTAPLAALPAHCRVSAIVEPSIRIEVWMPATTAWNGRFLGLGSSDIGGTLNIAGMTTALNAGYATASTDGGHRPDDLSWLGNNGQLRDFAYRAIYEMTAQSRAFLADFYGRPADYRYFNGCALGGHQGLMQAVHFPGDYDGIVAGSPSPSFVDAAITRLWSQATLETAGGQPAIRPESLALVNAEALAQCDAADGAADGVLEDPRRCAFEPGRLQCAGTSTGRCLSAAEVASIRQIYAGPPAPDLPDLPDLPGLAIGGERGWTAGAGGEPDAFTVEFFRRAVFANPDWNWHSFDFAVDSATAHGVTGWLDTASAELASFRSQGGKLILYQGWNDTAAPPEATIAWYEAVAAAVDGTVVDGAAAAGFARLFMVPGMAQCGSDRMSLDFQNAVEDWVERGVAPDRVDTAVSAGGSAERIRPLCPYPHVARNRGTNRDGSLVCAN